MRILQLCKKFPFPLKDGESIAITHLAKAYHELGCKTTLLAMNTSKHWFDLSKLPESFNHYQAIHAVNIDNRLKPLEALRHLFSGKSFHIERFIDKNFEAKLVHLLQNNHFDVIQLETLYLAPYLPVIRKHSAALVSMRAHNVEHEIWERIAANSPFYKKWFLEKITPRLKEFEIDALNQYDLMVGISDRDVASFRDLGLIKKAVTAPIGMDYRHYDPDPSSFERPLSLSFIGSLDWMPNIEGLKWFLDTVWKPVLHPLFPDLPLHIAGRNAPTWLKRANYPNVTVHGEVECAREFINQHSVMIAPLLSGSGMRAKILEAMALGKVTISTHIGLEGIRATHKEEALFADSPEDFVSAIHWCKAQGPDLVDVGNRAQVLCSTQYDNLSIATQLLATYREMVAKKPALMST